jgi:hypothetical protein
MDLESITEWIEQEKSVLVLGPNILFNNEKSLLKEFSKYLEDRQVKHQFNDEEELFSSTTKFKLNVFKHLPKFFDALECSGIYLKIAEIPFHLIISLSPDLLLEQTFKKNYFDHDFSFYYKGNPATDVKKPTKQKPLLYNLLGIRTEYNSMVLCFNHLFDYLVSVLGKNELPEELRTELSEAQTIFFLGFEYDKWYFKLIMRLLNKDDDVLRQASFKDVEKMEGIINFYTDEFNFVFIKEMSGYDIIDQIYNFFDQQHALRKPMPKDLKGSQDKTNIITLTGNYNVVVQGTEGDVNINQNQK